MTILTICAVVFVVLVVFPIIGLIIALPFCKVAADADDAQGCR